MERLFFLFGQVFPFLVAPAIAIFAAFFFFLADLTGKQRRAGRERRIAEYRKSPDSRLLRLND
jgi:hypothetical protein